MELTNTNKRNNETINRQMGKKFWDIVVDLIKVLATMGVFAAFAKIIKKRIEKVKISRRTREDDRKIMMEVLEKVELIEPELKKIKVQLKDLSENQKTMLNMQNVAFFVFNEKGHCEYASPALCQLIKHPESRILQSGWLALLIESDIDRIKKAWDFAVNTVSVFDEIFTYRESKIKVHCIAFHKRNELNDYNGSFAQLKITE